jgi:hypothetical protein
MIEMISLDDLEEKKAASSGWNFHSLSFWDETCVGVG